MSTTSAAHHVAAIVDLLDAADASEWTPATPTVERYWDVAQNEKGPGAGQPGEVYVWSPTSTQLEQFTRDGEQFDQSDETEVQIWSLDATEARQLQTDVTQILGKYIDDNKIETPYSTVRPSAQDDFREQKSARRTDHYIMSVSIDTRGLSVTRQVEGTAFDTAFDAGFA